MSAPPLDPADVKVAVDAALAEDLGRGDITTEAVIPADTRLKLVMATRQDIVLAGLPVAMEVSAGSDGSCNCADCPFMELNTLEKMYLAMVNGAPRVEISEDLRLRAFKPLEKMLEMSPPARSVRQAAE